MTSNNIKSLLALLIVSAFFTGCINTANPSPAFFDKTNTPISINSSSLQESTQTPIPIFSTVTEPAKDDYIYLLNLLENNGNCDLPCFWGITPGKSVFEEAKDMLLPLNNISDSLNFNSSEISNVHAVYKEKDLGIYLRLNFATSKDKVVSWVYFDSQLLRELSQDNYEEVFNHPLYNQILRFYSIPNILSVYGEPISILLRTNSDLPPQQRGNVDLLLIYYEKGFFVQYNMPMEVRGINIVGCPENSTTKLFIVNPSGIESTSDLLERYSDPHKFEDIYGYYQPINEVTSISQREFFEVFSKTNNKCIETPAIHWPPP